MEFREAAKEHWRLDEPQGIAYRADINHIYVAIAGDGSVRVFDAASFARLQTIKLGDDDDNLRFDAAANLVWAGYGSGALASINGDGKRVAEIAVTAHPESFQIEKAGSRIFVNVPRSRKVEVIDRQKKAIAANWSIGLEISNFPMALDENRGGCLLFVEPLPGSSFSTPIPAGSSPKFPR